MRSNGLSVGYDRYETRTKMLSISGHECSFTICAIVWLESLNIAARYTYLAYVSTHITSQFICILDHFRTF